MISVRSDNHGRLVANIDKDTLANTYGIKRKGANILFLTDGTLDDYPDWLENYTAKVDAVLRDAEAAVYSKFGRTIECCKSTH